MADIFDEISEDMRREQMTRLWKTYGWYVISALVVLVLAVGGYQYWTHHKASTSAKSSESYNSANDLVESGKTDEAIAAFGQVEAEGDGGYRAIAGLRIAELQINKGETAAAIATYEKIAADSGVDQALRDYAEFQSVSLALKDPARAADAALKDRLEKLALPGAAWAPLVEERLALLEISAGNVAGARERLERLVALDDGYGTVKIRAKELLSTLPAAATAPASAAPKAEPSDAKPE